MNIMVRGSMLKILMCNNANVQSRNRSVRQKCKLKSCAMRRTVPVLQFL